MVRPPRRFYREAMARPPDGGGGERYRAGVRHPLAGRLRRRGGRGLVGEGLGAHRQRPVGHHHRPTPASRGHRADASGRIDPPRRWPSRRTASERLRDEPSLHLLLLVPAWPRAPRRTQRWRLAPARPGRTASPRSRACIAEAASIRVIAGGTRWAGQVSASPWRLATIAAEASRLADATVGCAWSALRDRWQAWGDPYQAAYAGARLALAADAGG